jgi:hypothetical protein
MRNYWIIPGSEENWRQALISKGIWGLEEKQLDKIYWLAIVPNDLVLFYVTGKVKGIVGYGVIRGKFYQDIPLWKAEIQEGRVKWPLRFEFDVEFLLPEDNWRETKIPVARGAKFRQPLIFMERKDIIPIINELNPNSSLETLERDYAIPVKEEIPSPTHEDIKNLLLEIGKVQRFIATPEYKMGSDRLDVVWRRLPESVPTYAFEVQVGGDLYHALGKLKHAHDIWNSRIFLVASSDYLSEVNKLLAGTFHEIQAILKFIAIEKVQSLHKSKLDIYRIEKDLGIIP